MQFIMISILYGACSYNSFEPYSPMMPLNSGVLKHRYMVEDTLYHGIIYKASTCISLAKPMATPSIFPDNAVSNVPGLRRAQPWLPQMPDGSRHSRSPNCKPAYLLSVWPGRMKSSKFIPSEARFQSGSIEILVGAVVVVVVVMVVVRGHFWTSRSSGSILQRFGFKLLLRASRVAKIL